MIEYITQHFGDIIQIVSLVVAAASAIAALTPTPKDDGIIKIVRKIVDMLALNVGKAKNKDG